MAQWGFGLRAKSMLALALACLLALLPASLVSWQVLEAVRAHFGEAYARNFTQLNAQNILAPIARDLALSRRLADSTLTRDWLLDEDDPAKRERLFREADGYRRDFHDGNYFVISALSRHYFLNDANQPFSDQPRYTLDPDLPNNAWFFNTLANPARFNINVNPDHALGVTKVWLNVVVLDDDGNRIGLAGTGFDLSGFLDAFIHTDEPGVTPMAVDRHGTIQAHPDPRLIAFGAGAHSAAIQSTLHDLLYSPAQREALSAALIEAETHPGRVVTLNATMDGQNKLLALVWVPELNWHIVSAVDLLAAELLQGPWFKAAIAALVLMIGVLLLAFAYAVERLVLRPLRNLQQSATALSQGNYAVTLPPPGRDELGDLSRAFESMAGQIQSHTAELEDKVRQRTHQLEETNREMAAAQKKISDSIDYASLIQRALLPNDQLAENLGPHHFIMWHPRDVVGGDFYLFRRDGERYLIGIIDCAGHGVPGALMTMLARAAFDDAMNRCGITSPATLLSHADTHLREMLQQSELPRAIATNMDAGLVFIDREAGLLRYAGAKISLYWSDGEQVEEIPGGRRPLFDRRVGSYSDSERPLFRETTYYLATDGYLDQAGGEHGFGFGDSRFAELLRRHARLPMAEQAAALDRALHDYRGELPQRDDITVLSFRID